MGKRNKIPPTPSRAALGMPWPVVAPGLELRVETSAELALPDSPPCPGATGAAPPPSVRPASGARVHTRVGRPKRVTAANERWFVGRLGWLHPPAILQETGTGACVRLQFKEA